MIIRTNSPTTMDTVLRILSTKGIRSTKRGGNEAEVKGQEGDIRLMLQSELDSLKFDFANSFILVDGNTVWSYKRITKELDKIKKSGTTEGISNYFYTFMHTNFTIAHYNIKGWIENHPSYSSVLSVLKESTCPAWKTDVQKILDYIK